MKTLPMSEKLLSVICMVQSAKKLFVNETDLVDFGSSIENLAYTDGMKSGQDWLKRTQNYFKCIDDGLINTLGLKKNHFCLEAILRYEITDEMKNTSYDELAKFTFTY